jgi:hypothetical protein
MGWAQGRWRWAAGAGAAAGAQLAPTTRRRTPHASRPAAAAAPPQTLLNGDIRLNIDMCEMHSFDPPLYRACRDYPREVRAPACLPFAAGVPSCPGAPGPSPLSPANPHMRLPLLTCPCPCPCRCSPAAAPPATHHHHQPTHPQVIPIVDKVLLALAHREFNMEPEEGFQVGGWASCRGAC